MRKLIILLLGALLSFQTLPSNNSEIDCLAKVVYYEARGESERGKLAVALATLNRLDNPRFPKTICEVVYQKNQFSWAKRQSKSSKWKTYRIVAQQAYDNRDILGDFQATHFHNLRVNPKWKLRFVARIDGHKFYM